jgi:hypothetical protein
MDEKQEKEMKEVVDKIKEEKNIDDGSRATRIKKRVDDDLIDIGGGIMLPRDEAKKAVQDLYTADESLFPKIVRVLNVITFVLAIIILIKG